MNEIQDWDQFLGFFPRQQEALEAMYHYRYLLYGGARGGGKSRFLRWSAVDFLLTLYHDLHLSNVTVGLFCETYPDLRDRQINKISIEFPQWLGKLADTKENGLSFKLTPALGGGVVALRNLDDPSKYQSAEFAGVFVDEVTKTKVDTFNILRGSMRWPGVHHTIFVGATNPGGVGHAWVKSYWIDSVFPPELRKMAKEFHFIQSLPSDNPMLDETYWDDLNSLPPDLQRAWVKGEWDVFSGMAFSAWSIDHIIADFEIPSHWPRDIGIDWGYNKPFCALFVATDPDTGRKYIYRELYQSELTDVQQARLVATYMQDETIRRVFADPSMWTRRTAGSIVTSTADVYAQNGVILVQADNDRLSGKRKVDRLLMPLADGKPGVQVFKSCKNFIRTFPILSYDKYNVEDINTEMEDHPYDAFRYSLTAYKPEMKDTVVKRRRVHPLLKMHKAGVL